MSFMGNTFIFNGTPSEFYDLRILDFEFSNPSDGVSGGSASVKEEWLYRREVPHFYGRYYEESLEFDFTVGSFSAIDGASRSAIQGWLLGKATYLPLRIVQGDLSDITYNVILTQSTQKYVGNVNYAISLHAKCDRPWGVYNPPLLTKNYYSGNANETFDYVNESVYSGYNKPTITFTMKSGIIGATGAFSIINLSESSRESAFSTGLYADETITIDCDREIITSSVDELHMSTFNKKFLRLIQGVNSLYVTGNIVQFTLATSFAKGVGA